MTDTEDNKKLRPVWVWIITIFFAFSSAWTLFSMVMIQSGQIPVSQVQKAYLSSLTVADYIFTLIISLANLAGAISLFLLRRIAVHFFLAGFSVNILLTLWHIATEGWEKTLGGAGFAGTIFGWCLLIAACGYVWTLRRKKVLT